MYVTLEQAKTTLWQRRSDFNLRRKVRDYLGELPDFLQQGPRAVLARQLASPTLEFQQFAVGAQQVGLPLTSIEFTGDKFCTCNPDKLALAKMTFYLGRGRNGGEKTKSYRTIDLDRWDGKPLNKIQTLWGENFVALHHRLLTSSYPTAEISDTTAWLRRMGGKPALFWPRLLSLFICDGILFENFHTEGHEQGFTRKIIQPALAQVKELFGQQPLIVPLVEVEHERNRSWSWYPGALEMMLQYSFDGLDETAHSSAQISQAHVSGGTYV